MHFVVKLHPEINVKSKDVRKRFIRLLEANVRLIFNHHELRGIVQQRWDRIDVTLREDSDRNREKAIDILSKIPGIEQVLEVVQHEFESFDDITENVLSYYQASLKGKTFAVRVKRKGKHDFSSMDLAKYVGSKLFLACDTAGVSLKNPQLEIQLEVDKNVLTVIKARHRGLGGMPLPTQEDVVSLISGGFDSSVSSYHMIRRGAKTHFCFFNLGGRDHEIGVRQMSHYLWQTYSPTHRVKFVAIDFAPIVADILEKVENGLMGVVLKRMMLRAAEKVASNLQINALVTGECLGQVSSQTLTNLHVIDQVTDKLVLRPLICTDKLDIINLAKEIGTHELASSMPEYCGVISVKPNVKAKLSEVIAAEQNCDLDLINQVVRNAPVEDIRALGEAAEQEIQAVEAVFELPKDAVVIDIRSPAEIEHSPLELTALEVKEVPFYKLASSFADMPQDKVYYLYCDRGVMSKMQALLLHEHGHHNVKVYRP